MAWGQRNLGIDDLVRRIAAGDPSLSSLTLMRTRKLSGHEDVAKLCAAIRGSKCLQELSITSHDLDTQSARHVAEMLKSNQVLKTISIGNGHFGDAAMAELAAGVAGNSSLTQLDLEQKGLTSASGASICTALSGCPTLTRVTAAKNKLGDAGIEQLVSQPWASRLVELDLHDCDIGSAGLAAVASATDNISTLESLSLAYNDNLDGSCAAALHKLLGAAGRLQKLQLQHTRMGDAGAAACAAALQEGCCVSDLDLGHTGLTDAAGCAITEALANATCRLAKLNIEGNSAITDATARAIAAAASQRHKDQQSASSADSPSSPSPQRTCLTHLNLSSTSITTACLEELSTVPGLRSLSLLGCNFEQQGGQRIAELIGNATTPSPPASGNAAVPFAELKELVVSGCKLGTTCCVALLSAISGGGLPCLESLEMGANHGVQDESFSQALEQLRASRPEVAVHWKTADQHQS